MIKVLNVCDPHFRAESFKAPIGREQDFYSDVKNKVNQIVEIIKKEEVDLVTIAGDIFDIKQPSRYDLIAITNLIELIEPIKLATKLKKIITISGNHDLPHSSQDLKHKSIYAHFVKIGMFEDCNNPITIKSKAGISVTFKGFDYLSKIATLKRKLRFYNRKAIQKVNHYNAVLVHEHALPRGAESAQEVKHLGSNFSYDYLAKNYKNIDCFFMGHYHKGFPTVKIKSMVISNPWNLVRLARNNYVLNNEHIPNVSIISYKRTGITFKDIPLKVRDYLITNIEITENEREELVDISTLVQDIKNTKETINLEEVVLNRKQKTLLKDILQIAKDNLQN